MKQSKPDNERGAVSIFVVVFCAMFVTIITISFVSLMIRAQQQASNADLSNSAYDAAMAGVEDGKRVVLKYRQCLRTNSNSAECTSLRSMFASPTCNMVKRATTGSVSTDQSEMPIQSTSGSDVNSKALDQAYTCVTIGYTAAEKELQIKDGESILVPIEASGAPYDTVKVSWFVKDSNSRQNLEDLSAVPAPTLPSKTDWMPSDSNLTRPPILRTQWIQYGGSFDSADFDKDTTEGATTVSNTNTVFLYPSNAGTPYGGGLPLTVADDRSGSGFVKSPTPVGCEPERYNNGGYTCSVELKLPKPINSNGSRTGYLQLGALYNATKVKIELKNGNEPVQIVAPSIDSTGRANDLFRRIKVGVSFNGDYPRANFDINGNLCKDLSVTDTEHFTGGCDENEPNKQLP